VVAMVEFEEVEVKDLRRPCRGLYSGGRLANLSELLEQVSNFGLRQEELRIVLGVSEKSGAQLF